MIHGVALDLARARRAKRPQPSSSRSRPSMRRSHRRVHARRAFEHVSAACTQAWPWTFARKTSGVPSRRSTAAPRGCSV